MSKTCYTWGNANVSWINANWLWSQCSGSVIPPTPITSSIQQDGVDANTLIQPWVIESWNPYRASDREQKKKKRLIKLICKINGETFEEEKEIEKSEMFVDDIKMIVKNISEVNLDIRNVEE